MKATKARVLISSFALVIGLAVLAAPAFGQVAFQVSSLPQQVRIEGLTETMGAVQATNTATTAGTVKSGSSITVLYSAAITNLSTSTPANNQGVLTCSAGVTNTACAAGAANVSVGVVSGGQITISFGGDTYFAAGAYFLISEVRVNVNALGVAATAVTATLSGTSSAPTTNPITFTNASVPVAAIVNPSLTVAVTAAGASLQTCSIAVGAFSLTVTERYPAALATTAQEQAFTPVVGGSFVVNNGTTVVVSFPNVPSGLTILAGVPSAPLAATTSTNPQTSTGAALTFSFPTTAGTTGVIDASTLGFTVGILNSAGTGVTTGSLAALGTTVSVTASVSLGPIQAASSGPVSMAANTQGSGAVFTVGDCVTNLLFSFLTSQVGFDTTVQISNSSSDKLAFPSGGATAQNGTCTLTFYPTDLTTQTASAAGALGTPSQFTTPSIAAGGTYAFLISGTSFKNQSGYMFAVCRFLDAHGFAFVTNGPATTATISQGLLALVIPNGSITTGRLANFNLAVALGPGGTYESVGH